MHRRLQNLSMAPRTVAVVLARYRYRVYPTTGQARALARAFGCARVVFNDALATQEAAFLAGATTLPGASSFGFWKKRRFVTAVPSVGSTDGSRPLDCARPVDW